MSNPPESLRLFSLCSAMEWNHLPSEGGLYDQDPRLLEDFAYIFTEKSKYEKDKAKREKAKKK